MLHSRERTEADGPRAAGACGWDASPLHNLEGQEERAGKEKAHVFVPRREQEKGEGVR